MLTEAQNINAVSKSIAQRQMNDAAEALAAYRARLITYRAKKEGSQSQHSLALVFSEAAELIHAYPSIKSDVLNSSAEMLEIPYLQVREGVADAINHLEHGDESIDIVLAPAVEADVTIDDIFPQQMVQAIRSECAKTRMREIATAAAITTAATAVIGTRVTIVSGVSNTPVPPNLYTLISGNPSDKKSKTTDPVSEAMNWVSERMDEILASQLETLKLRSDLDNQAKEEQRQKLLNNRRDYFWEVSSFSPEAATKNLFQQEPRAGFAIFRDEANGLFHYKRWSSSSRGAGGAGDSSTDEFSNIIVTGWAKVLRTKSIRVDGSKDRSSRMQSLSILGCLQNKYLSEMHDFAIDNNGWTSRWLFFRATEPGMDTTMQQAIDTVSPVQEYIRDYIVPFLSSVKVKGHSENKPGCITLRFSEDDGAQDAYIDFWNDVESKALLNVQASIDPAYTAYLRKGHVRVLKFCTMLHLFEAMKGAHRETFVEDTEYPFATTGFKNAVQRVDTPITYETLQRALKLEQVCLKEYQHVAEDAFAAKFNVERALEDQEEHERQSAVLRAIQQEGSIDERILKKKMRTRTLSTKTIGETIAKLVRRGCISRERGEPNARWYVVTYIRQLRA